MSRRLTWFRRLLITSEPYTSISVEMLAECPVARRLDSSPNSVPSPENYCFVMLNLFHTSSSGPLFFTATAPCCLIGLFASSVVGVICLLLSWEGDLIKLKSHAKLVRKSMYPLLNTSTRGVLLMLFFYCSKEFPSWTKNYLCGVHCSTIVTIQGGSQMHGVYWWDTRRINKLKVQNHCI